MTKPSSAKQISEALRSPSIKSGIEFTSNDTVVAVSLKQSDAGFAMLIIETVTDPGFIRSSLSIVIDASPPAKVTFSLGARVPSPTW